jgi:hypothetical protein
MRRNHVTDPNRASYESLKIDPGSYMHINVFAPPDALIASDAGRIRAPAPGSKSRRG